jgi:tetratricopeptide (TPR) repeat protein
MAVKTEQDLPADARALWLKALAAYELRNYGYAISLLQAVLKQVPEFLGGRKLLRQAEVAANKGKKSFLSGLSTASLKGASMVKKDPVAAMELAEKSLETEPHSVQANSLLKEAALAAGFPEIAAFALETIVAANPKDTKALHELAQHYSEHGQVDRAVEVYTRITEINPADLIALKRGKDASARASMASGGWEEVASSQGELDYRSLIKDKDLAVSLEQQSRVVKSDEMIDQQIVELYARAEEQPESVDIARRIGGLFEQKQELESAIWWYDRANELTKGSDPTLVRKLSDLRLKVIEQQIVEREQYLEAAPDDENAPRYQEELEALRKDKAEMRVADARRRVERNPTDLQFRFELGEELMQAGQFKEAIPELQKARNSPSVRIRAMVLLSECYEGRGMQDFAQKTLEDVVSELQVMDATKKDALYKLGLIYEKSGNGEKAMDCWKQIYEVDYGYLDVAERVESAYGA